MGVRRQIYLEESDNRLLEEQSRSTGMSVSELIRRAVNESYGSKRRLTWEEVNRHTARVGSGGANPWKYDPLFDAEYVEEIIAEYDKQQGVKLT